METARMKAVSSARRRAKSSPRWPSWLVIEPVLGVSELGSDEGNESGSGILKEVGSGMNDCWAVMIISAIRDWREYLNNKNKLEYRSAENIAMNAMSFPFLGRSLIDSFRIVKKLYDLKSSIAPSAIRATANL